MRMLKAAGALLSAMLAGGCSGGFHRDVEPTRFYVLRAAVSQPAPAGEATLRVGRTIAAPGLDSDRIVLVQADHRLEHYAASRWVAPVPDLVESLAVDTLRGRGFWAAVNGSRGAFPADYYLQIAVRRFEADYTQGDAPKVYVVLDCTIGRRAERERLESFLAEGSATASANRLGAVVAAFEAATQAALATLAQRSEQALKTSTAPSTP